MTQGANIIHNHPVFHSFTFCAHWGIHARLKFKEALAPEIFSVELHEFASRRTCIHQCAPRRKAKLDSFMTIDCLQQEKSSDFFFPFGLTDFYLKTFTGSSVSFLTSFFASISEFFFSFVSSNDVDTSDNHANFALWKWRGRFVTMYVGVVFVHWDGCLQGMQAWKFTCEVERFATLDKSPFLGEMISLCCFSFE